MHSSAVLRCSATMPSWNGTRAYSHERDDIGRQGESQATPCESTAGIARVPFPDGLASETQHRSASCMASRSDPISSCRSQRIGRMRRGCYPGLSLKRAQECAVGCEAAKLHQSGLSVANCETRLHVQTVADGEMLYASSFRWPDRPLEAREEYGMRCSGAVGQTAKT